MRTRRRRLLVAVGTALLLFALVAIGAGLTLAFLAVPGSATAVAAVVLGGLGGCFLPVSAIVLVEGLYS